MKKSFLYLLFALVLSLGIFLLASCGATSVEYFKFELNEDGESYSITEALEMGSAGRTVIIPETYEGLPITAIKAGAFYASTSTNTTTLKLSKNLVTIEEGAFDFVNLESIVPHPENSSFTFEGGCLVAADGGVLLRCVNKGEINIPASVVEIGERSIRRDFDSLIIPEGVKIISDNAFANSSFGSLSIPESLEVFESGALNYCDYTPTKTEDGISYLGCEANPYVVCLKATDTQAEKVEISNKSKFIYFAAFYEMKNLRSVDFPDSLISIGSRAFYNCTSLVSVDLTNVKTIYDEAFYGCTSLYYVDLGSIEAIGYAAFQMCNSLMSLTVPEGATEIGAAAFKYTKLVGISLPSTLTKLGKNALEISALLSVKFGGTKAEWTALSTDSGCRALLIECSDGNIGALAN